MNNKVFKILARFDIKKWKRCRHFIKMELTGNKPLMIYEFLMNNRISKKEWNIETIHKRVVPDLSKKSFLNEVSRLNQCLEGFITFNELKKKKSQKDMLIREYYLTNNDTIEWEKSFFKSLDKVNRQGTLLEELELIKTLHNAYFNTHPFKAQYSIDILTQLLLIANHTLSSYQDYIAMILQHEKKITRHEQKALPALKNNFSIPTDLFEKITHLYNRFNAVQLNEIIQIITISEHEIHPEIMAVISGILKKIINNQIKLPNEKNLHETLVLVIKWEIKSMDELGYSYTPTGVYAYINSLLYNNQIIDANAVLNTYKVSLKDHPIFPICSARILVAEGHPDIAIDLLNGAQLDNVHYQIRQKILLIMAYSEFYEEADFIITNIENYRAWLRYHKEKLSDSVLSGHDNFLKALSMVILKDPIEKIQALMNEPKIMSMRRWLDSQIKKRYQIDTSF